MEPVTVGTNTSEGSQTPQSAPGKLDSRQSNLSELGCLPALVSPKKRKRKRRQRIEPVAKTALDLVKIFVSSGGRQVMSRLKLGQTYLEHCGKSRGDRYACGVAVVQTLKERGLVLSCANSHGGIWPNDKLLEACLPILGVPVEIQRQLSRVAKRLTAPECSVWLKLTDVRRMALLSIFSCFKPRSEFVKKGELPPELSVPMESGPVASAESMIFPVNQLFSVNQSLTSLHWLIDCGALQKVEDGKLLLIDRAIYNLCKLIQTLPYNPEEGAARKSARRDSVAGVTRRQGILETVVRLQLASLCTANPSPVVFNVKADCEQFGVSHQTLRDDLRTLARDGFIEIFFDRFPREPQKDRSHLQMQIYPTAEGIKQVSDLQLSEEINCAASKLAELRALYRGKFISGK